MQLPKIVFSFSLRGFMVFVLITLGRWRNNQVSDFSESPEAIESTWVKPPSCQGCASCPKRTPKLQSLVNEHPAKHRCVHLQFAPIKRYGGLRLGHPTLMLWWQYYLLEFLGHKKHTVEPFHELHSQFIATFSVPPTVVRSCHEKQPEELARTIPKRFTFPFEGRNCYAQAQDNGQQREDISSQLTHFQFRWRAPTLEPKPKLNQSSPTLCW